MTSKDSSSFPPFHAILVLSSIEAERPLLSRLGRPAPGRFAKHRFRERRAQPLSRESPGPTSPDLRASSGPSRFVTSARTCRQRVQPFPKFLTLVSQGLAGMPPRTLGRGWEELAHSGRSHQQRVPRVEASGVRASGRAARPRSPPAAAAAARWLLERRMGLRPAHSAQRRAPRPDALPGAPSCKGPGPGRAKRRAEYPTANISLPMTNISLSGLPGLGKVILIPQNLFRKLTSLACVSGF